jgi:hypothetical protein
MTKVLSLVKVGVGALSSTFFKVDLVLTQDAVVNNTIIKRVICFMVYVIMV